MPAGVLREFIRSISPVGILIWSQDLQAWAHSEARVMIQWVGKLSWTRTTWVDPSTPYGFLSPISSDPNFWVQNHESVLNTSRDGPKPFPCLTPPFPKKKDKFILGARFTLPLETWSVQFTEFSFVPQFKAKKKFCQKIMITQSNHDRQCQWFPHSCFLSALQLYSDLVWLVWELMSITYTWVDPGLHFGQEDRGGLTGVSSPGWDLGALLSLS